jgi:hypothetical protein
VTHERQDQARQSAPRLSRNVVNESGRSSLSGKVHRRSRPAMKLANDAQVYNHVLHERPRGHRQHDGGGRGVTFARGSYLLWQRLYYTSCLSFRYKVQINIRCHFDPSCGACMSWSTPLTKDSCFDWVGYCQSSSSIIRKSLGWWSHFIGYYDWNLGLGQGGSYMRIHYTERTVYSNRLASTEYRL